MMILFSQSVVCVAEEAAEEFTGGLPGLELHRLRVVAKLNKSMRNLVASLESCIVSMLIWN